MAIRIDENKSTRDLPKFLRFPLQFYQNKPCYVPALEMDELQTLHRKKNPSFEHCEARYFLAYDGLKVVGRVAAIINHKHIKKWNEHYMRFGRLDFIDDPQVVKALLDIVENWAQERNLQAVHGPLGFTDLDREGMLIEGFNEQGTLATLYNHSYYPLHLDDLGYMKDIDWVEFELKVPKKLDPKITKASTMVLTRNNLQHLKIDNKRQLLQYAPQIFQLINEEYSHLYGAVPLSKSEIDHYVRTYFNFVHPDFVPLIVDEHQIVVAFGVAIPSLSRALQICQGHLLPFGWLELLRALKTNHRADLYLIAVKKRYQCLGVNLVLMDHFCRIFNQRGIQIVESNPELETNRNVQSQWKILEKRQHKRRRCFIKYLE